jgi:hypothetical protein
MAFKGKMGRPRKEGVARTAKGRIRDNLNRTIAATLSVAAAQRGESAHGMMLPGTAAIYIMRAEDRIKVGVSKHPAYRSDKLRLQYGFGLVIEWAARGDDKQVRALELTVHRLLRKSPYHIKGEWYRASVESVAELVMKVARRDGVKLDREIMPDAAQNVPQYETTDTLKELFSTMLDRG